MHQKSVKSEIYSSITTSTFIMYVTSLLLLHSKALDLTYTFDSFMAGMLLLWGRSDMLCMQGVCFFIA